MANEEIKAEIKASGLKFYEVARALKLNDGNFSRKLRFELSDEFKQQIRSTILELQTKKINFEKEIK